MTPRALVLFLSVADGRRLAGLIVGFAGVVALVGIDVAGEPRELLGAAAILLAAAGYATGPMLIKRGFAEVDPRATTTGALIVAALALTPVALAAPPDAMPPAEALASIAVLGTFCTALAFVLFTALVGEVGPGRATVITYVAPLVALALGAVALHERPDAGAIVGLALIVAGSSLATRAPRSPDREIIEYYERTARQYATEISPTPPAPRADALRRLVACLPSGATVLEVGSGTGRDADFVEALGAHVRRTDVARSFIELQAERGKQAELLDLLTDELGGRYHGVLAMCVLIHVDRARADAVLHKVATALLPHGAFLVSVREGAAEQADAHDITYWRRDGFAARLTEACLHVEWDSRDVDSADDTWLTFLARRSSRQRGS